MQRPLGETRLVLAQLATSTLNMTPVIIAVTGTAADDPSYRFGPATRSHFEIPRTQRQAAEARRQVIVDYALGRGRVSSTEIVDLLGITVVQAGRILAGLTEVEALRPSRPNRAGRGLYYLPNTNAGTE